MAFNPEQTSPTSTFSIDVNSDEYFYAVIERLKVQKALPRDSFVKDMPFFNFSSISKESQVKDLFQDVSDPNVYKSLIKNIISIPEEKSPELISKRLSAMQVMEFAQIILYKVLACPDENCPNRPREVATHNQYKDYEYECPFYHHDKDRRRMVLAPKIEEEFLYKANYSEDRRKNQNDMANKCARNYFESMFHPLYYKMFRCKREYCNLSQCCPFYHSEDEKKTWDRVFSNFIRKDRISYVKDKQKYYEQGTNNHVNTINTQDNRILRSGDFSTPSTPQYNNYQRRPNNNMRTPQYQPRNNTGLKTMNDWYSNKENKAQSATKLFYRGNKKTSPQNPRKESGESFEGVTSPVTFKGFNGVSDIMTNGAC